jgi:two-component system response regulator ArlR
MNVLIVEDEKGLALEIDEFLSHEGLAIDHFWTKRILANIIKSSEQLR